MAQAVYLVKRALKGKKRNGQHKHTYALRWFDIPSGEWKCEKTGTADKVQAEALQKLKWAEVNGLAPPRVESVEDAAPAPVGPTWDECSEALERAMAADNLRPSYIADAVIVLESVRNTFPSKASPADVTADDANEYKRQRAEAEISPWTLKGDLATAKAVFGKWLGKECGLLKANPFENVKPPKCDEPDVRIVTVEESDALFTWLADRWNNWQLPAIYLEVAALVGWRATEIASLREEDLMADGTVRCVAQTSKTRKYKYGWLPADLRERLAACASDGLAFGKFSGDLRRLLMLWKKQPHHAAKVRDFSPDRLVGWLQDELQRFHADRQDAENEAAKKEGRQPLTFETFSLHDFRRTAITGMQMAGVTEKEASVMVGATPEVIRRHYEKLDQIAIAKKSVQRRLGAEGAPIIRLPQSLRAACARPASTPLDDRQTMTQTGSA